MKRGDFVKYKQAIIEPWRRNQTSQEQIAYFTGELKIEEVYNSFGRLMLTFSYPPGGIEGRTGNWDVPASDFDFVRVGEPEKCKWSGCGKTHNDQGLCVS